MRQKPLYWLVLPHPVPILVGTSVHSTQSLTLLYTILTTGPGWSKGMATEEHTMGPHFLAPGKGKSLDGHCLPFVS